MYKPRGSRFLRWSLGSVAVFFSACTTGPSFMPDSFLRDMASTQFQQMQNEMPVSNNPDYIEQVRRVGQRVAAVVESEMPDTAWEFVVFEDAGINAFAMPGGKIGVNTGLLELVDSDDELAAVMGHEVAHVLLEHANQRISTSLLLQLGQVAAAYGTESMEMSEENRALLLGAMGAGAQIGVMLPFSRGHESQADKEGLMISARAGYDPRAAITFWEKMSAAGGEQPAEFLSTHPSHGRRISDIEKSLPEALEVYRQSQP